VRLVREIGRGATGAVFQGHHTVLGRDVAVKFLLNVAASDAEGQRRFMDEARAAACVRHPNLTQIFHADVDGGTPYLVLEYVHGPTLRQLLEYAGTLAAPVGAAVVSDMAAAVAELHSRGIIHRDIKPSNALVDPDGRVCVTDFGLALRRSHATAAEVEFAGTPAYMAPEMFEGRVSPRSDVYAMGVTAFQLLTGTTPFSGSFHELRDKHAHEPLPVERLREAGVPPEVIEVVERATNKQAMFRYKTAPDFARALREAARCGAPETARARKQLCDLAARRADHAPQSAGGAATGEVRGPRRAGDPEADADTTLYTETISRIASIKRERRRHPATDAEGSSTLLAPADVAAPSPVAPAGPAPAPPPAAPQPQLEAAAGESPPRPVPGVVLSVGILGILYGTLAILWIVGVLTGSSTLRPTVPPADKRPGVAVVLVLGAVVYFLLSTVLVPAAAASLQLRPWGRRLMVAYATADLCFQLLMLLLAVAWVEPATVNELAQRGNWLNTADRAALEAPVLRQWVLQWGLLSLFPAFVLFVMTRRQVVAAFRGPTPEAPNPGEFTQPAF
jgi:hypothetical protein